jgi:leader peptidase (prepilin peptidase)/N-methyltransferase
MTPSTVSSELIGVIAVLGLSGALVGSFLNVCIARLPVGESIVRPPSRCPECRAPIRWFDNIPVLSYLILRGHCRACRARISLRYPIVELLTAVAFVVQGIAFADQPAVLGSRLVLTALLIALFGTDLDTGRLPDILTLPGVVIGLAWSLFGPPGFEDSLLGAALGAGILLAIRWLWRWWRGVDGMGLGDVKMLAMIGAFLGWRQILVVLCFASFAGAAVGVSLMVLRRRTLQSRLPFGTFLALAAFAASVWGEALIGWYASLYRT